MAVSRCEIMRMRRHSMVGMAVVSLVSVALSGKMLCQDREERPIRILRRTDSNGFYGLGHLPNSELLVVGTGDGLIRLWNPADGEVSDTLDAKAGRITRMTVDPRGRWVAAVYVDKSIAIWDLKSKAIASRRRVESLPVNLHSSPDGETLICCGPANSITLWSVSAEKETRVLEGHHSRPMAASVMRDGSLMASVDSRGNIIVWEFSKRKVLHRFKGHEYEANCLMFLGDTALFATGSANGEIKIWNARDGKEFKFLEKRGHSYWCMAVSPDGKTLAAGNVNGGFGLWDVEHGKLLKWVGAHDASIAALQFIKDGRQIVSSCSGINFEDAKIDGEAKIWSVTDGK